MDDGPLHETPLRRKLKIDLIRIQDDFVCRSPHLFAYRRIFRFAAKSRAPPKNCRLANANAVNAGFP